MTPVQSEWTIVALVRSRQTLTMPNIPGVNNSREILRACDFEFCVKIMVMEHMIRTITHSLGKVKAQLCPITSRRQLRNTNGIPVS